jgi:site-specific recombinase XerC
MRETGHPEVVIRQWFDDDHATRKQRDERVATSQEDVQNRCKPEEGDAKVALTMHPHRLRNASHTIVSLRDAVAVGESLASGTITAGGNHSVLAKNSDIRTRDVTVAILARRH